MNTPPPFQNVPNDLENARPWISGVRNPMHDSIKRRWRQVVHGAESETASSSSATAAAGVALLGPSGTTAAATSSSSLRTGATARASPPGNLRLTSNNSKDAGTAAGIRSTGGRGRGGGDIAYGKDGRVKDSHFRRRRSSVGLTRGQRIAASHGHYDMRTAAEVLRRSPLPESAVRRKMRQIIGARLGDMSFGRASDNGGGSGYAWAGGDSNGSVNGGTM